MTHETSSGKGKGGQQTKSSYSIGKIPCCNGYGYLYVGNKKRFLTGDDLLSQGVSPQVPSALEGLTSWFGMEQGVSLPLESPEEPHLVLWPIADCF
jgi:hypothetical protein